MAKNQRLKPVQLRCGHRILVPSYQSSRPEDYADTPCPKCEVAKDQKR